MRYLLVFNVETILSKEDATDNALQSAELQRSGATKSCKLSFYSWGASDTGSECANVISPVHITAACITEY